MVSALIGIALAAVILVVLIFPFVKRNRQGRGWRLIRLTGSRLPKRYATSFIANPLRCETSLNRGTSLDRRIRGPNRRIKG